MEDLEENEHLEPALDADLTEDLEEDEHLRLASGLAIFLFNTGFHGYGVHGCVLCFSCTHWWCGFSLYCSHYVFYTTSMLTYS